jgi:hypothetical protein
MQMHVQFLRRSTDLALLLVRNGWRLMPQGDRSYRAQHPGIRDERAARSRLHLLGLLTSGSLRIEFGPSRRGGGLRSVENYELVGPHAFSPLSSQKMHGPFTSS